jgi:hypothetical protein
MMVVISIQLYFLSHDSLHALEPVSLQDVFPDFATTSSSSSSLTEEGRRPISERRNITQGKVVVPVEQQQRGVGDETRQVAGAKDAKSQGIDPILKILKQGGYDLNDKKLFSAETMAALPKWDDLSTFYGPPVILGLETCETFRQTVPPEERLMSIAGTFNSGTNFLHDVLRANCWNPKIRHGAQAGSGAGIRWQVPVGFEL